MHLGEEVVPVSPTFTCQPRDRFLTDWLHHHPVSDGRTVFPALPKSFDIPAVAQSRMVQEPADMRRP